MLKSWKSRETQAQQQNSPPNLPNERGIAQKDPSWGDFLSILKWVLPGEGVPKCFCALSLSFIEWCHKRGMWSLWNFLLFDKVRLIQQCNGSMHAKNVQFGIWTTKQKYGCHLRSVVKCGNYQAIELLPQTQQLDQYASIWHCEAPPVPSTSQYSIWILASQHTALPQLHKTQMIQRFWKYWWLIVWRFDLSFVLNA